MSFQAPPSAAGGGFENDGRSDLRNETVTERRCHFRRGRPTLLIAPVLRRPVMETSNGCHCARRACLLHLPLPLSPSLMPLSIISTTAGRRRRRVSARRPREAALSDYTLRRGKRINRETVVLPSERRQVLWADRKPGVADGEVSATEPDGWQVAAKIAHKFPPRASNRCLEERRAPSHSLRFPSRLFKGLPARAHDLSAAVVVRKPPSGFQLLTWRAGGPARAQRSRRDRDKMGIAVLLVKSDDRTQ
ncbi:hypothetical protein AAFF_G00167190 [Aldrovandia affinis]|uniref:Uncharacterized protein n=1 Tax=Aldrovandia affinis TaxID=143900 RepID=A0AAD7RMH3_9TELE|nr:hypothetical protein AAFF_G00167190 [Aldrovandia affinis]